MFKFEKKQEKHNSIQENENKWIGKVGENGKRLAMFFVLATAMFSNTESFGQNNKLDNTRLPIDYKGHKRVFVFNSGVDEVLKEGTVKFSEKVGYWEISANGETFHGDEGGVFQLKKDIIVFEDDPLPVDSVVVSGGVTELPNGEKLKELDVDSYDPENVEHIKIINGLITDYKKNPIKEEKK